MCVEGYWRKKRENEREFKESGKLRVKNLSNSKLHVNSSQLRDLGHVLVSSPRQINDDVFALSEFLR